MTDTLSPAKRLSLSEILTLLLTRGGESHESVELGRSARGETTISVVARTREGETLLDAESRAKDTYDRLRATYPLSTGYVGAVADGK